MAGRRRARFPIAGRNYLLPFSKFGQASAPTAMDDELDGFTNGSLWYTTADDAYWCSDPTTGAAVWNLIGNLSSLGIGSALSVLGVAGGSSGARADIAVSDPTQYSILLHTPGSGITMHPLASPDFYGLIVTTPSGVGTISSEESEGAISISSSGVVAGTLGVPYGGTGGESHTVGAILVGNGTDPIESSSLLSQTATGLQVGAVSGAPTIEIAGGDAGGGSIVWSEDDLDRVSLVVDHDLDTVTLTLSGYNLIIDGDVYADSFHGDLDISDLTPIDTGLLGNPTGTIQPPILVTPSQVETMVGLQSLGKKVDPTTTRGDLIVRDNAGDLVRLPVGAANTVLSGGTDPSYSTLTALLDSAFGSTRGMLLYRGAAAWQALAANTAGKKLQTNGTSADPSWESDAVGGSVTRVEGSTSLAVTGTINLGSAATWVEFEWITPGGGGGSGRRGASGSSRFGGFGGYGGHYSGKLLFKISDLGLAASTIYYEVNTSGAGGGLTTTDNTNGAAGTDGGTILIRKDSSGGTLIVKGYGGRGGAGGTNTTTAVAAVTGYGIERGGAGGQPIVTGTADVGGSTFRSGAGGQAGTSLTSGNATLAGGAAGTAYFADGATPITNTVYGGSGASGVGVAGGKYGAGGRGGDAVLNGSSTNTAGTAGGVGILVVRYW